jgi:hypothetical protein
VVSALSSSASLPASSPPVVVVRRRLHQDGPATLAHRIGAAETWPVGCRSGFDFERTCLCTAQSASKRTCPPFHPHRSAMWGVKRRARAKTITIAVGLGALLMSSPASAAEKITFLTS